MRTPWRRSLSIGPPAGRLSTKVFVVSRPPRYGDFQIPSNRRTTTSSPTWYVGGRRRGAVLEDRSDPCHAESARRDPCADRQPIAGAPSGRLETGGCCRPRRPATGEPGTAASSRPAISFPGTAGCGRNPGCRAGRFGCARRAARVNRADLEAGSRGTPPGCRRPRRQRSRARPSTPGGVPRVRGARRQCSWMSLAELTPGTIAYASQPRRAPHGTRR
jgi:hypothetical protein